MAAKKRRKKSSKKGLHEQILEEGKRIEKEEKKIEAEEKKIEKETKKVEKLEKDIIFKLGHLKVSKKHVFDLAKVAGGALLGTGLGYNLVGSYEEVAAQLPWLKVIGLVVVSMIVASLLIYKEEHDEIEKTKKKARYLATRLAFVYLISFAVVGMMTYFFSPTIPGAELLAKILFIGSFSAVSGAITFSLL